MLPTPRPTPRPSPRGGSTAIAPPPAVQDAGAKELQLSVHQFNQLFPLPSFMRNGPAEPLSPAKLTELFQTALQLANAKDSIHIDIVRKLASEEGIERIKEMVAAIPEDNLQKVKFWQSHIRPFLLVITPRDTYATALEGPLRAIYDFLLSSDSQPLLLHVLYHCICMALNCLLPPSQGEIGIIQELVDLSVMTLKQILDVTSAGSLPPSLRKTVTALHVLCVTAAEKNRGLTRSVEVATAISKLPDQQSFNRQAAIPGHDFPGKLSPDGPRHDNDHQSIMNIRLLPTVAEILADRLPYVPLYDSSSWHVSGFKGLLDRQFRLLREDALGLIRKAVGACLQPGCTSSLIYQGNNLRTNEYKLQSLQVAYDRTDGFEMHISVTQPTSRQTPALLEQWWVETQNLDWGRLVVVVGKAHAMFCVVSRATCRSFAQLNEKNDKTKKKRVRVYNPKRTLFSSNTQAYLVLNPVDPVPADIAFMLDARGNAMEGVRLMEFPTVLLASFKPMLSALQEMNTAGHAPMSEYLVRNSTQADRSHAVEHISPPTYAMNNFEFDLHPLTNNHSSLSYSVRDKPVTEALCANSTLDEGQANAVLNTLRRRLSLIQGPPGTGKSFTGEAIIEVLLANKAKAALGPIICICQTNHALDQLLEHLYLRRGIKRIVRLGSMTQSALIGELTLTKIMDETTLPLHDMVANGKRSKARRKVAGKVIKALEEFEQADPQKREELRRDIRNLNKDFETRSKVVDEAWTHIKARLIRGYDVVGVTTSGLAKFRDLLSSVGSKVMVCEEAGEVLEAHTLVALMPQLQHLILIGDHQQLRPHSDLWDFQSANPDGKPWSFDISLFERLAQPLMPSEKKLPLDTLDIQRRMHPAIAELIRSTLYPALRDAENVKIYPPLAGFKRRLFFFNHDRFENSRASGGDPSICNQYEVDVVKTVLAHLHRQKVYGPGEIAVITPYAAQLQLLKAQLGGTYDISMNDLDEAELQKRGMTVSMSKTMGKPRIRVATVDNFQGEEASVVIVSLVRSNAHGKCGFLGEENRVNVLLSRAKHGMIIIGNSDTYLSNDLWWKILERMDRDGNIGSSFELPCSRHKDGTILASTPQHFIHGSCSEKCGRPLVCGHACLETCHNKIVHDATRCQVRCGASLACGHDCGQSCHYKRPCSSCNHASHLENQAHTLPVKSMSQLGVQHPEECPRMEEFSTRQTSEPKHVVDDPSVRNLATKDQTTQTNAAGTVVIKKALREANDSAEFDHAVSQQLIGFVSESHRKLAALELALLEEQNSLDKSLYATVSSEVILGIKSRDGRVVIDGLPFKMLQTVHDSIPGRYDSAVSLILDVNDFLQEVKTKEVQFDNLPINDIMRGRNEGTPEESTSCLKLKGMLSALVLLIRCNIVLLADFLSLRRQTKGKKPVVSIRLDDFHLLCELVISMAHKSSYPRYEAEGHILIAKMIAIAREVTAPPMDNVGSQDTARAEKHLLEALRLTKRHRSFAYLMDDIEAVHGELSKSTFGHMVASKARRSAWEAHEKEIQDTEYWNVCANGHPFSVENEQSGKISCCECDAPVGQRIVGGEQNRADEDSASPMKFDSE